MSSDRLARYSFALQQYDCAVAQLLEISRKPAEELAHADKEAVILAAILLTAIAAQRQHERGKGARKALQQAVSQLGAGDIEAGEQGADQHTVIEAESSVQAVAALTHQGWCPAVDRVARGAGDAL